MTKDFFQLKKKRTDYLGKTEDQALEKGTVTALSLWDGRGVRQEAC